MKDKAVITYIGENGKTLTNILFKPNEYPDLNKIIGLTLKNNIEADRPIKWEDIL